MAVACPQVSAIVHKLPGTPIHPARVESNICTKKLPTSQRTHSSKIAHKKSPHCLGETLKGAISAVVNPSMGEANCLPSGCRYMRSTMGVNCR